jgi:hypothetical protein
MLECFSYGLTQFSPDYYYIAVNRLAGYDPNNPTTWEAVVLHKNFDNKANGVVEKIEDFIDFSEAIKVRPIRKF